MSLEQIQAFLESIDEVEFKAGNKEDLYEWVNQPLGEARLRKLKQRLASDCWARVWLPAPSTVPAAGPADGKYLYFTKGLEKQGGLAHAGGRGTGRAGAGAG